MLWMGDKLWLQVPPRIGLVKALKAANQTTWHDAFPGLCVAALRFVQMVNTHATYNFYAHLLERMACSYSSTYCFSVLLALEKNI
ncbi:hypothetical protein AgCh_017236 [Apium graveolens]